jgi:hypothetical protein
MKASEKLDLYKLHHGEYVSPRKPALVDVKPAKYLAIGGRGAPGGPDFQAKLQALYNVAFTIKMARKSAGRDYAVCKLEGLWWGSAKKADGMAPAAWNWKLLIRTPDFISKQDLELATQKLKSKGKPATVGDVKLESIEEGRCVQMLHVGPYDREAGTIQQMEQFAESRGLSFRGLHHEIYLSDPRRVTPDRLKTILRHPVSMQSS